MTVPVPHRRRRARWATAAATLLATLTTAAACGTDGDATPAAAAAVVPSSRVAVTGSDPDLQRTLAGVLETHRAQHEFVGAVLAVRRPDGATATATSGTRTPDADSPAVDPDVPWGIGSVTKTFVAVVVLQLAEEGRLDLDAGIARYVPDLAGADRITPRELLQHTSGLGEYLDQPAVLHDARRPWTPAELVAVAESAGRRGQPGGQHAYANTNYVVLGEIVEQVTGHPWDAEVRTRVIEPLGLHHTRTGTLPGPPGYGVEDGRVVDYTDRWDPSVGGAAGGLESTAGDLLLFAEALAGGRLLSADSQAQMRAFVPGEDLSRFGVAHGYGLGLERFSTGAFTVVGHLGTGSAQAAFMGFDPGSGAAVAVVTNVAEPAGPPAFVAFDALGAAGG